MTRRVSYARFLAGSVVTLCAAALSACAPGEPEIGAAALYSADLPEPDTAKATSDFTLSDYRVSPQDVLEINVFGFDKLSRTVQVDGTGRISLPLIGAVTAAGKTVSEVEAEITRRLGGRYLQSPNVSVFVKESVGLRVTVEGAVKKPGVYQLKGKTTLLQALAMAEGINEIGDYSVTVIRISDQRRSSAQNTMLRRSARGRQAIRSSMAATLL